MASRFEDGLVTAEGGDGAQDTDGGGRGPGGRGEGVEVRGQDARRCQGHVVVTVIEWGWVGRGVLMSAMELGSHRGRQGPSVGRGSLSFLKHNNTD